MRGKRHKIQKRLQKSKASSIRSCAKRVLEEAANETTIQMAELQKSYPGCSGSSSARNGARRAP